MAPDLKVVVICPWFYKGDAVGTAAHQTYRCLADVPGFRVRGLWTVNDYPDIKGRRIESLADLLLDQDFLSADILIYIFAVYHPFFDALLIGNGRATQIVRFHNVTPKALMPEKHWPVIDRSFVQIQNFVQADEIWADSQENLEELERQGQDATAHLEPLAVTFPVVANLARKPIDVIRLLYVGRFFESKGVTDLVEACTVLRARGETRFVMTLMGNLRFSDPDYVETVRAMIAAHDLKTVIDFAGTVSANTLAEAYRSAHVFVTGSRHEGFCVPVIEGLAAGCIPVSYDLSNLRFVAGGLGRLAKTTTPVGLADVLAPVMDALRSGTTIPLDRANMTATQFDVSASGHVAAFTPASFAERVVERVKALGRKAG